MGHRLRPKKLHTVVDVEISEESREIARRLCQNPYDVFRRPYLGYMIFLFSDVDRAVHSWILRYGLALDSLTGPDIGFILLGGRIPLEPTRITRREVKLLRPPRSIEAGISPWQIEDLVASGQLQFADLNESDQTPFVVNEAVYSMAREIRVTQHLPCIIAVDGLPQPDLPHVCVPICEESIGKLYGMIQAAIGRLQQHPALDSYRTAVDKLATGTERLASAKLEEQKLRHCMAAQRRHADLLEDNLRSSYAYLSEQCATALEKGQERRWPVLLASLERRFPNLAVDCSDLSAIPWYELKCFRKTIHMLGRYASRPWPLEPGIQARLTHIYDNYARELLPDLPEAPPCQSPAQVDAVRSRLVGEWRRKVEMLTSMIPLPSSEILAEEEAGQSEFAELLREIDRLRSRLMETEEAIRSTEWQLVQTTHSVSNMPQRPSFCSEVQVQCATEALCVHPTAPSNPARQQDRQNSFWPSWVSVKELLGWICSRRFSRLPGGSSSEATPSSESYWKRAPTAFASYASSDRAEVLLRVQGMRAWQPGLDVFLDFHSLFPGERWRERLEKEIRKRDRFLLFWSAAARSSEYVEHEWRTALRCRGLSAITPVPLDPPDQVPPPEELSDLHFNDLYLEMLRYARASERSDVQCVDATKRTGPMRE